MPEVAVVLDPRLRVTAEAFAAAWNANPDSATITSARAQGDTVRSFDPALSTAALALLGALATNIAASVLYDLAKEAVRRAREGRRPPPESAPSEVLDVMDTVLPNGTRTSGPKNACLQIDYGEEWPITVNDPFSEEEEKRLGWYFEEHLTFPFTDKVKFAEAGASVAQYGEKLFDQVFADRRAYARYADLRGGLDSLVIEIAGEPEFHALHWEALKDPDLPRALSLDAVFIRRNRAPQTIGAAGAPSPTINVLVVTARPGGAKDVAYRTISRPLVEALGQANLRVKIDLLRPGTYRALTEHLEATRDARGAGYYHVIHFDCHGALLKYDEFDAFERALVDKFSYQSATFQSARYGRPHLPPYEGEKGFIFLEPDARDAEGKADPVEAGELANLLQAHKVPIVILNACQSAKQARAASKEGPGEAAPEAGAAAEYKARETSVGAALMAAGAQLVVAMGYSVTVSAARLFMQTFYGALFDHGEPAKAIRRARQALLNDKTRRAYYSQTIELEDWLLPVAYRNREARLQTRDFTGPEATAYFAKKAGRYRPQPPTYGFFGRDLDALAVERLVLDRNLLLIRGMGGAGKSALLRHLGEWWQTTGFVDEVFYFGWDEKAWNRQQILRAVAEKLLPAAEFHGVFVPMGEAAQQAYLAEKLRGTRHLLILDNLESITGAHMAIKNTLPEEERAKLRDLLRALEGGKTVVLMGSRAGEEWLLDKLRANTYALPGLDEEAATGLANEVLRRRGAEKHRGEPALRELLALLAGYPLPIEVVLANLPQQTPAEVLRASTTRSGTWRRKTRRCCWRWRRLREWCSCRF